MKRTLVYHITFFIIVFSLFIIISYYYYYINNLCITDITDINNLPIEDRVKYYMKDAYHTKIYISEQIFGNKTVIENFDNKKTKSFLNYFPIYKLNRNSLKTLNHHSNYIDDLQYILSLTKPNNNYFQVALGDINSKCFFKGTLAKARLPHDENIILLKLNYQRHWKSFQLVNNNDIPYKQKNNKIIWRGASTGVEDKFNNKRYILVDKYFNHKNKNIDIGVSAIVQTNNDFTKYLKKPIDIKEQLQSKFLISVEGNDVASGLKWQLYSNSVVFMTKPKVCTWLMEDILLPGVHYILLKDDYSDLEIKYKWALKNDKKCMEISKNATNYIKQFLNKKKENRITELIMNKYFENVVFSG